MSNHARCGRASRIGMGARAALLGTLSLVLGGCGGSDGSVGIGGGQDPDPVAIDFPIAYTKGPLFDDQMQLLSSTDIRDQLRFNIGTDLYMKDRASPTALERNITIGETQGQGDVMGVEISADGTKVLFAMRGPFDPNLADEDQPTWNIWEYDIPFDALTRVISSDITAEEGHDSYPQYLADGRIIFSSTRQRQSQAILLDEGKPQFEAQDEDDNEPAFLLHVINTDGTGMHQVSFNQSHDLAPAVLDDGRVLFSRWDNAPGNNGIHLYTMNPDGRNLSLLYGAESHLTGTNGSEIQFINAREMPDGRVLAIARPFDHPELGGDIIIIDTPTYVENLQPTALNAGMPGPAQTSATTNAVRTDLAPSEGGRFSSAFPLWDGTGRVLVSWTICRVDENGVIFPCDPQRLADPNAVLAPPLYGIWMYDPVNQTQQPIVTGEEGLLISGIVAAQPRPTPQIIIDGAPGVDLDIDLVTENAGILNIRSVYDIDGVDVTLAGIPALADPEITVSADLRPARFIRIVKPVSMPNDDVRDINNAAFGLSTAQGMREILAYAPIEPDGSVRIKVPANVAFGVSILDKDGRRISPRHQNWMQVRPGEELVCDGCHTPNTGSSHGRPGTFSSVYAGSQDPALPFPNTDPILFTEFGDTMAETRTRRDPAALNPSVDLVYEDVWTDPLTAGRAADLGFSYTYAPPFGLSTEPPIANDDPDCLSDWDANCRITVNYQTHIEPLWSLPRLIMDDPVDPLLVTQDNTCTAAGCHSPVDAVNPAVVVVPKADLDLVPRMSINEPDFVNSYEELLFPDNAQTVNGAALQDIQIDIGPDINGNPILVNVSVPTRMSVAGANAIGSFPFFSKFDAGGTHEGYLTPAELRLISEWLDLGGQYFNNPFDPGVPVN